MLQDQVVCDNDALADDLDEVWLIIVNPIKFCLQHGGAIIVY